MVLGELHIEPGLNSCSAFSAVFPKLSMVPSSLRDKSVPSSKCSGWEAHIPPPLPGPRGWSEFLWGAKKCCM